MCRNELKINFPIFSFRDMIVIFSMWTETKIHLYESGMRIVGSLFAYCGIWSCLKIFLLIIAFPLLLIAEYDPDTNFSLDYCSSFLAYCGIIGPWWQLSAWLSQPNILVLLIQIKRKQSVQSYSLKFERKPKSIFQRLVCIKVRLHWYLKERLHWYLKERVLRLWLKNPDCILVSWVS